MHCLALRWQPAIFSMEMISVGVMYYIALVPCVISSLIAHGIASYFNVTNEFFAIENIPDFTILNSVKISALAILCALVSILFCVALHSGEALYKKYLPNNNTRVFIGGLLCHHSNYACRKPDLQRHRNECHPKQYRRLCQT